MLSISENINQNSILKSKLNNKSFVQLIAVGLILSIIFRVEADAGILFIVSSTIAFLVIISVLILPLRLIIYPLFILIVSMPDITHSFEERGIVVASPWQFSLGPVTPAIFVFAFLFILLIRLFRISRTNPFNSVFVYLFFIATLTSLWFGFFNESFARFLSDAKIPMFFCTGLVIFYSYYKRFPNNLIITSQVFIALAAGNYVLDFFVLLFGSIEITNTIKYLSFDSGKGLILIFIFIGIANLLKNENKVKSLILVLFTLFLLINYQTRWLIVSLFLGIIMIAILLGLKKSFIMLITLFVLLFAFFPLVTTFSPEVWEIAYNRFSFLENISTQSTLVDIDIARAGSIYNSTNLLWEKYAIFTGMGYGSWYSDIYFRMPFLTSAAFDSESIQLGKFYRVHDFFFHFLFKFGIIGTFIYILAFLKPLKQLFKIRNQIPKSHYLQKISIVLFGIAPFVITFMYWTGKGLLFSAFYIVITYEWVKFMQNYPIKKKHLLADNSKLRNIKNGK